MFNPNELKNGNLVMFKNQNFIVDSIISRNNRTDLILNYLPKEFSNYQEFTKIEEINFIPLSESILEELKFEKFIGDKDEYFYQLKQYRMFFIKESKNIFEFCMSRFIKIHFLHELQNLILLITKTHIELHDFK